MSRVIGANIISDGLIFYLDTASGKCYPKSGVNVNDLISNIGGTLENGVGYDTDNLGNFDFDGIDDYIDCTNDPIFDFNGPNAFSIETWVKFDNLLGVRFLVSKWVRPTIPDVRAYYFGTRDNRPRFAFASSIDTAIIVNSDTILNTGVWYHLVVTYDGSVSANGVNFYVNDNLSTKNIFANNLSGVSTNTEPLQIGGQDTFFTDGQIANVKIYNREITQDEVEQNYNALKYRFI
jgi:hypothetical protein